MSNTGSYRGRGSNSRDLVQVAALIVGAAAASAVIRQPGQKLTGGLSCGKREGHMPHVWPDGASRFYGCDGRPASDRDQLDAVVNTYASSDEPESLIAATDPASGVTSARLSGSNGRAMHLRKDADGVWLGGVLLTTSDARTLLAEFLAGA